MLDQRILFIDAEAMVIDKPAGLPVDTPRRGGDSVVARLGELKQGFHRPTTPMHRLDAKGDKATTHWRKIAVRGDRTLLEFRPVTGRTHQLRVHAREAFGRGIVGDRVYGVPGGPMLLHASRLVLPREKKAMIDVSAPLPEHFGEWADAA